jgi:hypothetical protein
VSGRLRSSLSIPVASLLSFGALSPCANAAGDSVDVQTDVYLGAISNYYRNAGSSTGFDTFYVAAELNFYPTLKPYHAGLFVDYRNSTRNRLSDNFNVGAYVRYDWRRWDATTWVFSNRSPGSSSAWVYAARLRYRMTDRSKLGMEALAPFASARKPKLMAGYYGSVTKSLSVRLLAGAGLNTAPDFAARVEMQWQIR